MPKTLNKGNWFIEGLHPREYASQFGDGTRDGMRFYNCSDSNRAGEVIANPQWDEKDWCELADAANRLATSKAFRAERTNLLHLAKFAIYMAYRAKSSLPWLNREV